MHAHVVDSRLACRNQIIANEVKLAIDVSCVCMELQVLGENNGRLVVATDFGWAALWVANLFEKGVKPCKVLAGQVQPYVFGFGGGQCHHGLELAGPPDSCPIQDEDVAGGGAQGVQVP